MDTFLGLNWNKNDSYCDFEYIDFVDFKILIIKATSWQFAWSSDQTKNAKVIRNAPGHTNPGHSISIVQIQVYDLQITIVYIHQRAVRGYDYIATESERTRIAPTVTRWKSL